MIYTHPSERERLQHEKGISSTADARKSEQGVQHDIWGFAKANAMVEANSHIWSYSRNVYKYIN